MTVIGTTPTFPLAGSSHRGPDPALLDGSVGGPVVRLRTPSGTTAWVVRGYDAIKEVLEDTRFSRTAAYAPGAPVFEGLFPAPPEMIVSLDPPEHTRMRALAEQAFSPARIEGMRPRVREVVAQLLEAVDPAGPVDLLGAFADPLAVAVIAALLGVPETDRDLFGTWIRRLSNAGATADDAVAAREELGTYMAGRVEIALERPGDDVLSALAAARLGEDRLGVDELIGLGYTLLGAGADSSGTQLANSVVVLLTDHRDEWRRLGAAPDQVTAAVDELLRTVNVLAGDTSGLPRIATEDVVVAGVTIRAGEAVFPAFPAGNRDEGAFRDAGRRDLSRAGAAGHLAFGHGPHRCLGAQLARLEMVEALRELTRRFPDADLAVPEHELVWRAGNVNHRLETLPVRLLPA